ncbi:MAG: hypothetical protein E7054_05875 [Lentisphaerae bacterium]|nr:hypothetical protein [Lentisphaerota bacterium]
MKSTEKSRRLLALLWKRLDHALLGKEFQNAYLKQDDTGMIRAVAEFYRRRPVNTFLDGLWKNEDFSVETADRAVAGEVTVINIPWKFPDGRIDWHFNPTLKQLPVNHEWLWQLGRMYFWLDMAKCFETAKSVKYAAAFNEQLRSWVDDTSPLEADGESGLNTWRSIECGIRLMSFWPCAFEIFRESTVFTDENLCLMLASMCQQAEFLKTHHRKRGNWLLMEMAGIYTFASQFPEFTHAAKLREFSVKRFSKAFCSQMLPDGMHDELSPDYHFVSLNCAMKILKQAQLSHRMAELPEKFVDTIEHAGDAVVDLSTPALTAPRTNDCYTFELKRLLSELVMLFPGRKDFLWAVSERKKGTVPEGQPTASRILPYAGFIAMRSSWDKDALYCCFDVGPIGNGHQHWDKLNINIYKGGEELLFDDGGGQYEKSAFRWHGRSAADHNTVLVDNMVQMRYMPKVSKRPVKAEWISNAGFDYAKASYTDTFAKWKYDGNEADVPLFKVASHTREVRFCKPEFFCVVDTLKPVDGLPHDYELRFQLDTLKMKKVKSFPGALMSDFGKEYDLLIVPLFPEKLKISAVSGRTKAPMAGWFVGRNDLVLHPATTVRMLTKKKKNFRFATLLFPIRRGGELPEITALKQQKYAVDFNGRHFEIDLAALNK